VRERRDAFLKETGQKPGMPGLLFVCDLMVPRRGCQIMVARNRQARSGRRRFVLAAPFFIRLSNCASDRLRLGVCPMGGGAG